MIARLRRCHRRLVGWVGAVAAIGFVAALAVRPSRPPEALGSKVAPADTGNWLHLGPSNQLPSPPGSALPDRFRAALKLEPDGVLLLLVEQGWNRADRSWPPYSPDLLVYWTREGVPGGEGDLPETAKLLGSLAGPAVHSYRLPVSDPEGAVFVLSLAHDEIVARGSLDEMPRLD